MTTRFFSFQVLIANLEIRLFLIVAHVVAAFVGAGGLIVVTVVELGSKFYFNEPPKYDRVDCRPVLLAIGALMFILDFAFVFICSVSKDFFVQEEKKRKYLD